MTNEQEHNSTEKGCDRDFVRDPFRGAGSILGIRTTKNSNKDGHRAVLCGCNVMAW
jgi:hypothetical protein